MNIRFKVIENKFLLFYSPEDEETFVNLLEDNEYNLRKTFKISNSIREYEIEENQGKLDLIFCIGKKQGEYIEIDKEVLGTENGFYFHEDIKLEPKYFIAERSISILKKIDNLIERDMYIGGKWQEKEGIPVEAYESLLKIFPKGAELKRYAEARISSILKEYFMECDKKELEYQNFINRREEKYLNGLGRNSQKYSFKPYEYNKYKTVYNRLQELLKDELGEKRWQNEIEKIIRILYPKYIESVREVTFPGVDGYEKQPDFILIDTNGFIDILEIKKPSVQIMTNQASYRNNYVPRREFAGSVQQIEKYILCLNTVESAKKKVIEAIRSKSMLNSMSIDYKILNPQGILLLGRSKDFNEQQKNDFELVKRQYKHIVDIMTYDDLLERIHNIVRALEIDVENIEES